MVRHGWIISRVRKTHGKLFDEFVMFRGTNISAPIPTAPPPPEV